MKWSSELAVVWLREGDRPYLDQFPDRAAPRTSNYYYLAMDALERVYQEWPTREGREPWAFCRDEHKLYSPSELRRLESEWREVFDRQKVGATAGS